MSSSPDFSRFRNPDSLFENKTDSHSSSATSVKSSSKLSNLNNSKKSPSGSKPAKRLGLKLPRKPAKIKSLDLHKAASMAENQIDIDNSSTSTSVPRRWKNAAANKAKRKATTSDAGKAATEKARVKRSKKKPDDESAEEQELTQQQENVLNRALDGESLFFTGAAGTGKSFLLHRLVQEMREKHGSEGVAVTASTGIAACHIGGVTLHSFAGVGLAKESADVLASQVRRNARNLSKWRKARVLIIDEISMVSGAFFDKLEFIGRHVRYKRDQHKPFGGLQIITTGDFLQLPPVERVAGNGEGGSGYCFESKAWHSCINKELVLTQVFRQSDAEFVEVLNDMRMGLLSVRGSELIESRVGKTLEEPFTRLYPVRHLADKENQQKLSEIDSAGYNYEALDEGPHAETMARLLKTCMAPSSLSLKVGAQVMLIKNLDVPAGLVNGAQGKVIDFSDCFPVVEFHCGVGSRRRRLRRTLQGETWTYERGGELIAKREQIPLILGWAITIHKSQGMSIDRVQINFSRTFEKGQAYVALSRATSLEGVSIIGWKPSVVNADPRVVAFHRRLEDASKALSHSESASSKTSSSSSAVASSASSKPVVLKAINDEAPKVNSEAALTTAEKWMCECCGQDNEYYIRDCSLCGAENEAYVVIKDDSVTELAEDEKSAKEQEKPTVKKSAKKKRPRKKMQAADVVVDRKEKEASVLEKFQIDDDEDDDDDIFVLKRKSRREEKKVEEEKEEKEDDDDVEVLEITREDLMQATKMKNKKKKMSMFDKGGAVTVNSSPLFSMSSPPAEASSPLGNSRKLFIQGKASHPSHSLFYSPKMNDDEEST